MKSQHPQLPPRGRVSLNVAVWLLGVVLAAQVGAIGWALHRKHQRALLPADAPIEVAETAPVVAEIPAAPAPSAEVAVVPSAPAEPEKPSVPPLTDRALFFFESALRSREQGDMKAALTQLRSANELQPKHPQLLYELAKTYEMMTLTENAQQVWDQIAQLGEAAGQYYRLAQEKFAQGYAAPPVEVEVPLRLGQIVESPRRDPNYLEYVVLRIPVQAKEGAVIDPSKVEVVTQFYDINGGEIQVTVDAQTDRAHWLSGEVPTWTTNSVELLDQVYMRPKPPVGEEGFDSGNRYYGYVVKLYYNDHLQDVKANPPQLASLQSEPGERAIEHGVDAFTPAGSSRRIPSVSDQIDQIDDSLFPLPR